VTAPTTSIQHTRITLFTSFNRDVPQEVVRVLLDHDSHMMTAHYARLNDKTVRKHWEQAHKVNIKGETVNLDPTGHWPRQPGPSNDSVASPKPYPTATAACHCKRPARTPTPA
jgi:hypothetical protein